MHKCKKLGVYATSMQLHARVHACMDEFIHVVSLLWASLQIDALMFAVRMRRLHCLFLYRLMYKDYVKSQSVMGTCKQITCRNKA